MNEHEQYMAGEHTKEHSELLKIRNNLNERISEWDKKLTESKDNIQKTIQNDVEKQIKVIQGKDIKNFVYFSL